MNKIRITILFVFITVVLSGCNKLTTVQNQGFEGKYIGYLTNYIPKDAHNKTSMGMIIKMQLAIKKLNETQYSVSIHATDVNILQGETPDKETQEQIKQLIKEMQTKPESFQANLIYRKTEPNLLTYESENTVENELITKHNEYNAELIFSPDKQNGNFNVNSGTYYTVNEDKAEKSCPAYVKQKIEEIKTKQIKNHSVLLFSPDKQKGINNSTSTTSYTSTKSKPSCPAYVLPITKVDSFYFTRVN